MSKSKSTKTKNSQPSGDETVAAFEQGMELLYKKRWAAARKVFSGVCGRQPGTSLAERSRRLLEVCELRLQDPEDPKDSFLMAVHAKNLGELDAAMDYCNRGGLKGRDGRFAYLAASVEGLRENQDEALRLLRSAIEMDSDNRVHAYHDPDFAGLREAPEFEELMKID